MRNLLILGLVAIPVAAGAQTLDGACAGADLPAVAMLSSAVSDAAVFSSAPSSTRFADTWSADFSAAIRSAAGTDGRLSRHEADMLAARTDSSALFADNAIDWLTQHDQKSVDVEKLIKDEKSIVLAAAKSAAGTDGRLSLEDGKKLPADLQKEYLWMRGKLDLGGQPDLKGSITTLTAGLDYMSESDSNVVYVEAPSAGTGAITPEEVRAALGAQHDALMRNGTVWSPNASYMGIAGRHPQVVDATEWFARFTAQADPNDPASLAMAKKFTDLGAFMSANLSNLTVVRFNESADPNVAITSSIFVVGRTADGRLVGVLAGSVET